jgi:putative membrane protein
VTEEVIMLSALVPATAASVVAHPYWHGGGGPGFGWWFIFPLLWFLLFASIVFLVARGARRRWQSGGAYGPPWARGNQTAISVLGERYARGEIDEAEYRARLEVLTRQL